MSDPTELKDAIAIIGMAGRFPGAPDVRVFWKNLCAGVESIRAYTPEELREAGVDPALLDRPGYVNAGAALDDAEGFDAAFFGYHPSEAAAIDPQHRVFLECAWDVLEDAGYDPQAYPGLIGLFGGVARNTYLLDNLAARPDHLASLWTYAGMIASDKDYCTTRIAYKLDLRGPCLDVQTACSTSGVAIHLACQSLLGGECDMALAGGARVRVPVKAGYFYEEGGIPSPDGHCRAFDAGANGTAIGSGVAMVALKPLADALRDGDHVYAVIRGSAINNDGSAKVGFTAPSVRGQAAAIAEALAAAGVEAESIGYVEAHGTGTRVGDPIEIAALTRAFRESTSEKGFCAIGSVKTNIGHLDAGAGVTGVIKTALVLRHGRIPPSLNYRSPNPQIDFESSPFFVNTELREWPAGPEPRRAGVSAFGLGGNNSHIVLEEAPAAPPPGESRPFKLLLLSARSSSALDAATTRLARHLRETPELDLDDAAYTLQVGRRRFEHRRALVCSDPTDACAALEPVDPRRVQTRSPAEDRPGSIFMFPGGGAQYPGMGLDLYRGEPVYRREIDRCLEILAAETDVDLRSLMFPQREGDEPARELERPSRALPTLFATEYALARLWMSWGILPHAMIGHSAGEYAAACLAGVISLEDALRLLLLRGQLFESLPSGSMLSVALSEAEVAPLLGSDLSVAAVNQPDLCVVSGPVEAIGRIEETLTGRGVQAKRLHIAVAAHSRMIEPILEPFRDFVRGVELRAPRIPYVSNVSGDWIAAADATDPEYWVRHLRGTVRFAEGVALLRREEDCTFLEVGPGRTLGAFTRSQLGAAGAGRVLPSLRHPLEKTSDQAVVLDSLGQLWLAGAEIEWPELHRGHERRRLSLPTYPFERTTYRLRRPETPLLAIGPAGAAQPLPILEAPDAPGDAAVAAPRPAAPALSRKQRILARLQGVIEELSGLDPAAMDVHASFLELGFESLFLTQASAAFGRELGVEITLRQLIEETPCLDALAGFVDAALPADALAEEEPPPAQAQPLADAVRVVEPIAAPAGSLAAVAQQLGSLAAELERISRGSAVASVPAPVETPAPAVRIVQPAKPSVVGPWRAVEKSAGGALSRRQQQHLERLVARLDSRCSASKDLTQKHRFHLADARTVAGFRRAWKELVYPLVVTRSRGSKVWDVDGNEYVDIAMGFGVNMLGHSPDFVTEVLHAQLRESMAIGPQTPLAGEVAELVCELTGMERAAFCNTGSEAVLAAIRSARTVTGRNRIATFSGDYHGVFDEVLGRGIEVGGRRRTVPVAPGIPPRMVEDTLILDYGDPASLRAIEASAGELAAVVVEPVQSRHPALQPREFLHALADLTREKNVPLIFDEMITGFRIHPAGAQAWFDVRADIATYGKVVAGGMPIGVVAGKSRYMDALDGGMWSFGDDSVPEAGVTWFAGTFVRHPLAMASAAAVLRHMKEQGPGLQEELNERTARFAERLNASFRRTGAPLHVEHFSSFFLLCFDACQEFSSLFYFHLRDQGIHVTEGRAAFFSTAHSQEDFDFVARAFEESARQMQEGGFFPAAPVGPLGVPQAEGEREVPLTEGQLEIWLAAHLGPDASRAYNLSSTLRLQGELHRDALEAALQQLVDRHDALRARFAPDGDVMRIAPRLELDIPFTDLSELEPEAREARIDALRQAQGREEFDLAEGPLFRTHVVHAAQDDHRVLLTAHHIVCDGWSLGVLTRELGQLYSAARRGMPVDLPEPASFGDYAQDQHEARGGARSVRDEAYWLERLAGPIPTLELPTSCPRPPRKTYRAARRDLTLAPELVAGLKQIGARRGCTGFSSLLAGFQAFLHRLTGSDDLVIGISAAGQAAAGRDDLVGHCVNLLPLRFQVDGSHSFAELAGSLKRTVLDALDHQSCTFGTLIRKLDLPRDPSRIPLVSVNFNLDPTMLGVDFDGLAVQVGSNPRSFENFDVFVNLVDTGRGITVECTYNTDLFDEASIGRRLEEFRFLLAAVVAEPDRPLAELALLPEAERRLLEEWNATAAPYPTDACLHRVFEAQVERTPEAPALFFEDRELSYAELNARANRLARHLRGLGVGPEVMVGVFMERSLEMVIALYAILKAGGAYVPLDPEHPSERLAFVLEDTGVPVLLTQSGLLERLPESPARLLCLDRAEDCGDGEADTNLEGGAGASNLAYVIYTSGSTGRPKGVMNEHRGICNRLFWMQDAYGLGPDDRVLQKTPFGFDVSVWEFFWPLQVGAALVVARPGGHRDARYLHETIRRHDITTLHFVPSMLQVFLEEPGLEGCRSLRRVICSGEALPFDLMQRCLARLPAELHNLYGPTEAAVDVTAWPCSSGYAAGLVPIGRPVANTRIHVLDAAGQPVPIGVPGQLCIGGVQVARGYWNRPELTAEKFVADPFSDAPDARLYQTGDLARWLPDGNLEYLGRLDFQVKIRGFRIELGEIEATLLAHPGLREAVVVAREDRPGDKRLVAYLVAAATPEPDPAELRSFLAERLPDYMLPPAFVFLEALPLGATGKVDRRSLPAPLATLPEAGGEAPRDELEAGLVAIWEDLLDRSPIGVRDDFFDLGGHSLLAVQVCRRIREVFDRELPVVTLFEAPTVAGLAEVMRGDGTRERPTAVVALQAGGSRPPFFFLAGGDHHFGSRLGEDQPVYRVQVQDLDAERHFTSADEMVEHSLRAIRAVQPVGPYYIGGHCFGGVIAFEVAQELRRQGQEVALLALFEATVPGSGSEVTGSSWRRLRQRSAHHLNRLVRLPRHELAHLARSAKRMGREAIWRKAWDLGLEAGPLAAARNPKAANYRARRRYVPSRYPGRVVLFRCTESAPWRVEDPLRGWGGLADGGVEVYDVPGTHTRMYREPHVEILIEQLREVLERAQAGETAE